jgi:large subunit ribosomal protein L23
MAFDFFRKKWEKKKDPIQEEAVDAGASGEVARSTQPGEEPASDKKIFPLHVRRPVISEKAGVLQGMNQYVFKVERAVNKAEITKSIERHYGVHVRTVRIINVPGKQRRMRGVRGWRTGYKKAIVQLKQGEAIDAGA